MRMHKLQCSRQPGWKCFLPVESERDVTEWDLEKAECITQWELGWWSQPGTGMKLAPLWSTGRHIYFLLPLPLHVSLLFHWFLCQSTACPWSFPLLTPSDLLTWCSINHISLDNFHRVSGSDVHLSLRKSLTSFPIISCERHLNSCIPDTGCISYIFAVISLIPWNSQSSLPSGCSSRYRQPINSQQITPPLVISHHFAHNFSNFWCERCSILCF